MSIPTALLTAPNLGELLRAGHAELVKFKPDAAAMLADAIEIADSTARADIESEFLRNADGWYDISPDASGITPDWLLQILRYLTARGMIERMTGDNLGADLVRFVKRA